VTSHRHRPEIEQELGFLFNTTVHVNFTPHLLPVDRGILTTIYSKLTRDFEIDDIIDIYNDVYQNEPFVHVLEKGSYPDIKDVRGSNNCLIGLAVDNKTETLIVVSVIDNLVKGASGQAIQNLNIMFGFEERTSLQNIGLFP
ncbi:MAG: Asd/ArgC dimerization domain-containing protein, partial [Thermodesulfovibrionales bacterium]